MTDGPRHPSIVDRLAHWAEQTPDAPFLTEGDQVWTWAAFERLVARVARALSDAGVGYGDRVVLYLDRKSAHVAGYLAALSIGAISVHLYPERPWGYVVFAAQAVDASAVLLLEPAVRMPPRLTPCLFPADDAVLEPLRSLVRHPVAYLMFTSGTTSTPKAVVTTQANVLAVTRALIDAAQLRHGDRELIFMPLGSTGGAGHLHAALLLGNHARLLPWFMADIGDAQLSELLDRIDAEQIDGILATPGLILRLLTRHRAEWARVGRRLRYLLANVTPMRQADVVDLLTLLPELRFVTYYGLTEASRSVMNVCRDHPGHEHAAGLPTPGVEVRIANADPVTGIGEIELRGPNVAPRYWEQQPATDADGWFRTGDWGRIDADGFVFAVGRIQDTINVDGLKCRPVEIEAVLLDHPEVIECAVVALPDPGTHHRIGAAVVLRAEADAAEVAEALIAMCTERLARFQVPRKIHVLPKLPRTDLGKLRRADLPTILQADG